MRNDMEYLTPRMLLEGLLRGIRSIPGQLDRAVDWVSMAKYRCRQRRRWKRMIIIELGDPRYGAASAALQSKITPDMNTWERLQAVLHADDIDYCKRHQLSDGSLAYLEFLVRDDFPSIDPRTNTFVPSFCEDGEGWYAGRAHRETDALRTGFVGGWLQ